MSATTEIVADQNRPRKADRGVGSAARPNLRTVSGYRVALLDWLACAAGGWDEPAPRAARAGAGEVAALGTAGHVLDFDDTWLPGIAHLSAPTAPAALVVAAEQGATVGDALDAYAEGFEAMAALAGAGHPALYDAGWHPTAVCGSVGAAVAAAALLDADRDVAAALAVVRSAGLRAAFGSDGKSLQVGLAASAGVTAARLAAAGATVDVQRVHAGWEQAYGAPWASEPGRAIDTNWIKAYPCCLQTHGAIDCALHAGAAPDGAITVRAHPVSRQAAGYDDVATTLEAKFSIPYTTAHTLLHGAPRVESFAALDEDVQALAKRITVETDPALAESEFRLLAGDRELAHVLAARGSPQQPLSEDELSGKVRSLAGERLDGALDDLDRPAADVLARLSAADPAARSAR
jgi:2-methylcitrate dehydratase PrpD